MKNLDRELSDAPKIIKIRSETIKLQPFKVGEIFRNFRDLDDFRTRNPRFSSKNCLQNQKYVEKSMILKKTLYFFSRSVLIGLL